MIKNLTDIETALGLKAGEFKTMYDAADEKTIDITGLAIVPKADYEVLKKTEFNERIENTKTAAVEIAIKKARTDLGLTFEGKTMDKLVDAVKTKAVADAGIAPDKKVKELEGDLDKMRLNFNTATEKLTKVESEYKQKDNLRTIRETIFKKIPENTVIPKEDVLNLFVSKNEIELSDTGIVFKKNGEVMKNPTTLSPTTIDELMPNFLQPYIKPAAGGGGGGDNPAQGKEGSFVKFCEEMQKANVRENTPEFNKEMQKRIADKTLVL